MSSARYDRLLSWYRRNARSLPWRETTDPYRIWISEIMLQQTQVKTVLPRYLAWFEQFPDIQTLASTPLDNVLKAWEGLGYYRRARFIHQASRQMIERHHGNFPDRLDEIMALPGVGRSTAGAIASFAFGQATPVLDGNVKRVLKRWHGAPDANDRQLWLWAESAINESGNPADWNQAMMELGAILCTQRNPGCAACPINATCESAFKASETAAAKQIKVRDVHWQVDLHTSEKGIWLTQRPDGGIWAGLWTPPITELREPPEAGPAHVHLLTHRRLHLYTKTQAEPPAGDGKWVSDLSAHALPTGIHRLLEKQGISA